MEMQSAKLDKITAALIGARKMIYGATKNGKGNWGNYASLEDIIEAINDPLLQNDIFVSQAGYAEDGVRYIVTQATHISGQFMRSYTEIQLKDLGNPQKALAAQTYTRRAGMEALFNIPRVDDDGEHGNEKQEEMIDEFAEEVQATISKEQALSLIEFATDHGLEHGEVIAAMKNKGWAKTTDIPKDALAEFKNELEDLANYESIV